MRAIQDAIGLLQFADIPNDRCDLLVGYIGLRRHVAEPPVVLLRATSDRAIEGGVTMMTRIVDIVNEGRSLTGTPGIPAVAFDARLVEGGPARFRRIG